jgi:hypothetical protein
MEVLKMSEEKTKEAYQAMHKIEAEERALAIQNEGEIIAPDAPLVVQDQQGNQIAISNGQFMSYYCKGATTEELFHCFNQTRATGLNPMIPGECYYFRTGDRPMSLFVGYPVYLRKAREAGLENLSFEFDDDANPSKCTVTLTIKGREPFIWPTWFDEVAATTRDGQLNARWRKAPRQMFIKCSVVNTIRMSLLADFTLPYTVEEMDDPVVQGYRTITQAQLDAHEEEATLGEVTAETHQVDMTPFRKKYFKALKDREMLQDNAENRKEWQKNATGKASTSDWGIDEYALAMDLLATIPKLDPDPEPPTGTSIEKQINEKLDKLEAAQSDAGDPGKGDIQPEASKAVESEPEQPELTEKTYLAIQTALINFPGVIHGSIKSRTFKEHAVEILGHSYRGYKTFSEADGKLILDALAKEKAEIMAAQVSGAIEAEEPDSETEGETAPLMTDGQFSLLGELVKQMPERFGGSIGNSKFRSFVFKVVGRQFGNYKQLTESESDDVLLAMRDMVSEENERIERKAEADDHAAHAEMNYGE